MSEAGTHPTSERQLHLNSAYKCSEHMVHIQNNVLINVCYNSAVSTVETNCLQVSLPMVYHFYTS